MDLKLIALAVGTSMQAHGWSSKRLEKKAGGASFHLPTCGKSKKTQKKSLKKKKKKKKRRKKKTQKKKKKNNA